MDEDQVTDVDTRNVKQTGVSVLGRTTVDLVPGTPRNIPSLYPASSLFSWRPADHLHLLRKHCLTYLTHTHTQWESQRYSGTSRIFSPRRNDFCSSAVRSTAARPTRRVLVSPVYSLFHSLTHSLSERLI